MRLRLALVGLLAQQCAAGAAPAADASKDFPAGWCDTQHGTPTRTTGECMCKTACEGSGCRREQGFIWYSYASCPSCKCVGGTDAGAAEYGYIGNIYDENGNQLPYNKAAEQGLIDAEMSSGILARKEELFRKLLFFIEMFASIVDESQDIFWNLAYNSVQAQLELHPSAPGHGTDHRRYHKYNKILSKF